jgi:hypothetical protein
MFKCLKENLSDMNEDTSKPLPSQSEHELHESHESLLDRRSEGQHTRVRQEISLRETV